MANYYVYFTNDSQIQLPAVSHFDSVWPARTIGQRPNFEQVSDRDGSRPEGWTISGGSRDGSRLASTLKDARSWESGARCRYPMRPRSIGGWLQKIAVQPGRTYLLAAWVKCEDLHGNVRLRPLPQRGGNSARRTG